MPIPRYTIELDYSELSYVADVLAKRIDLLTKRMEGMQRGRITRDRVREERSGLQSTLDKVEAMRARHMEGVMRSIGHIRTDAKREATA